MWKYRFELTYWGEDFCGWQRQPHGVSIQSSLEEALEKMTGESVSIVGSGRTDAGVHALCQVAHVILKNKSWDVEILRKGLNRLLPLSIRILTIQACDVGFHAQKNALKKQYSYYYQQGNCPLPWLAPFSWWVREKLNLKLMQEAVLFLLGEHDFKVFQSSGASPGRSTVRTLLEVEVTPVFFHFGSFPYPADYFCVRLRIVGTGFLKQMVRSIAGTLVQVGKGKQLPELLEQLLKTQERRWVGPTAPARGLWLDRVYYPSD